jgi:tetratricopeptide (TPR) repeat protein
MIAKNEEKIIGSCLQSVKDFVDEIILVDTGSSDRTVEVAKEFGARIFHKPWEGDFSAAKNYSLEQATREWVLFLDADEQLALRDAEKLRGLVRTNRCFGYLLYQRTYLWDGNYVVSLPNPADYEIGKEYTNCAQVPVIRLFRKDPRIFYSGRVHELVEPAFKEYHLPYDDSGLVIHHFGKVLDLEHLENKKRLYLDLGRQKAAEEPHSSMAQFEIGVQLYELHQFEDCIPFFEKAYALDKKKDLSLLYVAKALHVMGKMDEAGIYYKRCLKLSQGIRVFFEYGNYERDLGHFQQAISLFRKCLKIDPDYAMATFNLGGVYFRMGETEKGFQHIRKAILLDPDNETFQENFGRLAMVGGPMEEAVDLLENFMARFPRNPRCGLTLSLLSFKLGQFPKSLLWADHALQTNPKNRQALLQKAHALFALKRLEEGRICYQRVLEDDPQNLDSLMNLAHIAELEGKEEESLKYYKRALTFHPDQPLALKKVATKIVQQAPSAEALLPIRRAYEANPNDTECLLLLGKAYERAAMIQEAIHLFQKASQQNPKLERLAAGKILRWKAMLTSSTPEGRS